MPKPWDYVAAFNEKKDLEYESDYSAFSVNRVLSMHVQTVYWANEMNRLSILDDDMQFDFYMNGIPKGKRFSEYAKKGEKVAEVDLIQRYFGINKRRAVEYLTLLTDDQLNIIKTKFMEGGRK